ncbi:alpha beta domain protein, partial [Nannochloropsis gaditana CCMP526]|uniref:alpha beta domain protein n=1 Tax=Nannochloropsis gaditana (strain CCMP526) TaxID=1093141 RepID=UPI00029F5570
MAGGCGTEINAAMEDETCPQRLWGRPHEEETLPPVQLVTLRPRSGCSGAVSPRAVSLLEIPCRPHHRRHRNAQRPHQQPLSPPRGNEDMAGDETQGDTAGEGTEDAVTIFLIHGAMATWRQFSRILPSLRRHCRVVCYDAYGCGDGPKPENVPPSAYSTEAHFEDLLEVYQRFKGRRNVLVGHSFGSSQAMRLAAVVERELQGQKREAQDGNTPTPPSQEAQKPEIASLSPHANRIHPFPQDDSGRRLPAPLPLEPPPLLDGHRPPSSSSLAASLAISSSTTSPASPPS